MKSLIYNLPELTKQHLGVLCRSCGWIRVSWNVHDYRTCGCKNSTSVDGGDSYLRYGGMDMSLVQVVCVSPTPVAKPATKLKKKRKQ